MRSLIFGILSASLLSGCATMPWMKEKVPNIPACRHLSTRVQTKIVNGKEYRLARPNPLCMKKIGEPECGYCRMSMTDEEIYVGEQWNHLLQVKSPTDGKIRKKRWSTVMEEALLVPAESQAASKAFMINMCRITRACSGEIDRLRIKLDALDSVGAVVHRP